MILIIKHIPKAIYTRFIDRLRKKINENINPKIAPEMPPTTGRNKYSIASGMPPPEDLIPMILIKKKASNKAAITYPASPRAVDFDIKDIFPMPLIY